MKKNIIKTGFTMLMLVLGLTFTNNANAKELSCISVPIDCGDGRGTIGLACGYTAEEIAQEALQLAEAFCGY